MELRFSGGTLEVREAGELADLVGNFAEFDARTGCYRATADRYAALVLALHQRGAKYTDLARTYEVVALEPAVRREARPFQTEALAAWAAHGHRGVVVLPTGAGKSHVAVLAMADRKRSTLVVAPTLDLVRQWYDLLRTTFRVDVGVVGGGEHTVRPVTVTTYDSAAIHLPHLGGRFGLVVFDECHHLPSEGYSWAARCAIAPFRLGLTATPERADGRDARLGELVGPIVHRAEIRELSGSYLAEYDVERVTVELSAAARAAYDEARGEYLAFVRKHRIHMGSPRGFGEFMALAARSAEGLAAFRAHRRQRSLAFAAPEKLDLLEHLLRLHAGDRAIVFTEDNATAYEVSRRFLVPVITHQTRVTERSEYLRGLAEGRYAAVVTSRVLNEGVDVPDANVAVVLSGSGSVREHVQRLGRILRAREGKRATLYEIVAAGTTEAGTSERRREHDAWRAGAPRGGASTDLGEGGPSASDDEADDDAAGGVAC